MPILETSRDVTDPRREDCRQTVAIVLGGFFSEPDVEVCQLGCGSALPQSGGTLRIDAGPQQAIAGDGPNGVPGAGEWSARCAAEAAHVPSHEDNWCQASIALPHRNLLPLLVGLRVSSGSFFS